MADVNVGLLIRRPPHEVFQAIVDPAVTTKIWYTDSTGPMTAGAELTWTWAMYDASARVRVLEVEPGRRVRFDWGSTVEIRLLPWKDDTTWVQVTETGAGDPLDSTAGFSFLLASLKALLEHGIALGIVADAHPAGLQV
jgi:uncharacterized protein YndB with AHSA1/START domain